MTKTGNSYWAVRLGTGYIEIRLSPTKPLAIYSKLTKTYKGRRIVREQTFYIGGKVLGSCSYPYFVKRLQRVVNGVIEISKADRGRLKLYGNWGHSHY